MKTSASEAKKLKPAYIPMICPVCRGHKTVNWGKETCSVCAGLGYLKVPPDEKEDLDPLYETSK